MGLVGAVHVAVDAVVHAEADVVGDDDGDSLRQQVVHRGRLVVEPDRAGNLEVERGGEHLRRRALVALADRADGEADDGTRARARPLRPRLDVGAGDGGRLVVRVACRVHDARRLAVDAEAGEERLTLDEGAGRGRDAGGRGVEGCGAGLGGGRCSHRRDAGGGGGGERESDGGETVSAHGGSFGRQGFPGTSRERPRDVTYHTVSFRGNGWGMTCQKLRERNRGAGS